MLRSFLSSKARGTWHYLRLFTVGFTIMVSAVGAWAAPPLRLSAVFGHNMVLQSGADTPVWGATPGEKITVSIGPLQVNTLKAEDHKADDISVKTNAIACGVGR